MGESTHLVDCYMKFVEQTNDRDLALFKLFFMHYVLSYTRHGHSLEIDHGTDRADIGFYYHMRCSEYRTSLCISADHASNYASGSRE